MKISVIIPSYNAAQTLSACLNAVFLSKFSDFEVIVVDDNSSDNSCEILRDFRCTVVTLEHNQGTANARNSGAHLARGDILVFIDADVVIGTETLGLIARQMDAEPDITAITGRLSARDAAGNFFTRYKNLYMNYIFKRCAGRIDFLYGSIMAIRKKDFLPFDTAYLVTDDTELGQRYKSLAKTIILSPELEVIHLKRYSFAGLIKNDYRVPFWWTKSFLYRGLKDVISQQSFSHARPQQIASILVVYLILMSVVAFTKPILLFNGFVCGGAFILLNLDFFRFIYQQEKTSFLVKSVFFTFLDQAVMGLGILNGIVYFSLKDHVFKNRGRA